MSALTRLFALIYGLPPADTYEVGVERALPCHTEDGIVLRADRYFPRSSEAKTLATLLVRTPYGRAGLGMFWGRLFAERGLQVIIQSCRGTDDSSGARTPFRHERQDGLATLTWLRQQDWYDGRLVLAGPSYMGFTQWAIAALAKPDLRAMSTHATSSEFYSAMYPGGTFALQLFLQWMQITHSVGSTGLKSIGSMLGMARRLRRAVSHLPLSDAGSIATGKAESFWNDWVTHAPPKDEWWDAEDFSASVADIEAPNHLIGGWHDFLLPHLIRDYQSMERAGRNPHLTIGPWSHSSNGLFKYAFAESLNWIRAHIGDARAAIRHNPVRIFVMGAEEWREMLSWPPAANQRSWYCAADGSLVQTSPGSSGSQSFRYDPTDPTPNLGGAINATLGRGAGMVDNRVLERRADVLSFTSGPLSQQFEIIGPVSAEMFLRPDSEDCDVFVRICVVRPNGRSENICDGISRLAPTNFPPDDDGVLRATVSLWPTAFRFKAGERLRLQVSGGAHPRFARNLGTGEPLASGTTIKPQQQTVLFGGPYLSRIELPVVD